MIKSAHWLELQLSINLNLVQFNVKHHKDGIYFLGYWIWHKKKWNIDEQKRSCLNFSIPLRLLVLKFTLKGFFHLTKKSKKKKIVARRQDKWLFLKSDWEIIDKFNKIINRIKNYYAGSTEQSVLNFFWYLMKKSCALTLAHRNNKKNAYWAFKKYGKELTIKKDQNKRLLSLKNPKPSSSTWFNDDRGNLNDI